MDQASEDAPTRAVQGFVAKLEVPSRRGSLLRPMETLPFKARVRRLKALGLTISLDVGYRLSPRGKAILHG